MKVTILRKLHYVAGFASLLYSVSFTHNLRCGLEECRQLRWLVVSKNHGG